MVSLSTLLSGVGPALAPLLGDAAASAGTLARDANSSSLGSLLGPDDTASVLTGASDIARPDALTYATLAGVPRLAEALGPRATGIVVGDEAFALTATYEDLATGFRAVQLRSLADGRAVFSIDGTNFGSVADVVADLDLARPQASSPGFAAMVADARTVAVVEGSEVVFTGASLGGALAQVGGYEAAEAISAASPGYAGQVTVLTVDPLGGYDAAASLNGGRLDPAVLDRMNALNLRTAGDVVSQIGSHLGDTLTLPAVDSAGNPVVLSAEEAHVNLESLLATLSSDALFDAGARGDPGEIGVLSLLANSLGQGISDAYASLGLGAAFNEPGQTRLPGGGAFDTTGRFFDLDADVDGDTDLRILLGGTVPTPDDLLIG